MEIKDKNILILDADVLVLNTMEFFTEEKPIFTVGFEYTVEYHIHSERLHPSIKRMIPRFSGVAHHMMYNRKYLAELFWGFYV